LVASNIYSLGAPHFEQDLFSHLLDRLGLDTVHNINLISYARKEAFTMLQHAQMSHAFQSAATGVSVIPEDRRRASRIDFRQGRTYQISKLPELEHAINVSIFSDILELDDEDEQYFSRSLVTDYFTLAQRTLTEMDTCLFVHDNKLLPLEWY
jgi:hypothetical protein